ncbi:hypothetical protein A3C52_03110 [Candidatus Peribacteria bacterium RIFCSPHIGHO2_02_FULL_51_15]|nr:MAG: hypothetical protein A3C52_03110 [Candidatus Peribacteria bacterium RIFCSPHIGHO2_02_FULL_51_15]
MGITPETPAPRPNLANQAPEPELQAWSDLIKNKDYESLKAVIQGSTLEKLETLAGLVLESDRANPDEMIVSSFREKIDELKRNKTIDENLELLKGKLHVVSLLGITGRRNTKESGILENWIASPLRNISWFKDLKGTDIERTLYSLAANYIPSFFGMNFIPKYAERKIAEIDIRETIGRVQLLSGETIVFNGISKEDFDQWNSFAAQNKDKTIASLTEYFINSVRREHRLLGKPTGLVIEVTLSNILNPEGRKKAEEGLAETEKKRRYAEQWKPAEIGAMNFGEPVSAAKNGEKWEITVPEKQLSDKGGPRDEAAKTLKEAIIILKSAREIKIVSDENKLIFNFKKKSASIPAGTELDESFNEIFSAVHNGKIRTLILDDNMRARPFTAQWLGDGKFAMSVSPVWKAAINSLSNLDLESAEIGNKFIFTGNAWQAQKEPMPTRPNPSYASQP